MGCGCGGGKKGARRVPSVRVNGGPRSIVGGTAAGPTPSELRALGMQKAVSLTDSRAADSQRRRIEKLRREAIRKKLNK